MKISGEEKSIRKAISDIIYKTSQTYNFEDIGEKLLSYSQNKIKTNIFSPYSDVHSVWIIDINVKAKTIKRDKEYFCSSICSPFL